MHIFLDFKTLRIYANLKKQPSLHRFTTLLTEGDSVAKNAELTPLLTEGDSAAKDAEPISSMASFHLAPSKYQ